MICVETRHMKAVLKAQINKTDRNDARGIAQMMRVGLFKPVHVGRYVARNTDAADPPLALGAVERLMRSGYEFTMAIPRRRSAGFWLRASTANSSAVTLSSIFRESG